MNRSIRTVILVIALLCAVATTTPAASALAGDEDGTKFCKRVSGLNVCVAVDYGECTLWASAGYGGCLALPADE